MKAISFGLFVLPLAGLDAAALDELASPDQKTRDVAAAELRTTFKPVPRTRWDSLLGKLHKDQAEEEVLHLLKEANAVRGPGHAGGGAHTSMYQLDPEWAVSCSFSDKEKKLFNWSLMPMMQGIWVEPPAAFTGIWTCYYPNGGKYVETSFKEGKRDGQSLTWRASGTLALKGKWEADVEVGPQSSYDENGKLLPIPGH